MHTYEELKIKVENDDITLEQLTTFKSLINEFGYVFVLEKSEIKGTDLIEFEIHV